MPERKAMLTQLVNKALSGEVRSIRLVTEQLRHAETHAQPETGKGGVTLEMVRQLLDATDQEGAKVDAEIDRTSAGIRTGGTVFHAW